MSAFQDNRTSTPRGQSPDDEEMYYDAVDEEATHGDDMEHSPTDGEPEPTDPGGGVATPAAEISEPAVDPRDQEFQRMGSWVTRPTSWGKPLEDPDQVIPSSDSLVSSGALKEGVAS